MRKFKTGDIVSLKSGGPDMTVQNYHSEDVNDKRLTCMWFDNSEMRASTFLEDQLVLDE